MIIDGKAMAKEVEQELQNAVSHSGATPHVTVVTCAPAFATQRYIALKKRTAAAVGMALNIIELPETATTEDVIGVVRHAAMLTDGLIVQLPLPVHVDRDAVIEAIPVSVDIDGMHFTRTGTGVLPPVVAAIQEIARREGVVFHGQSVVIVGNGVLVGAPASIWAKQQGADVTVVTEETANREALLQSADIIISGVGKPGVITKDVLQPGVVLFDAGTSEDGGELKGDCTPDCVEVASLMTPVPGGIGPLTVLMLLKNTLASIR